MGKINGHNLWRGLIMGTVETIPGISSGTIAVVLGIYERLIAAINGLSTREWKQSFAFLIPLVAGIFVAVFSSAKILNWLLDYYPLQLSFFFLGLIIGIVPFLLKKVEYKRTFSGIHYIALCISLLLIALFGIMQGPAHSSMLGSLNANHYIAIFFLGWVASSAMILPGLSGSFILLVFGYYETIIDALDHFHLPVLLTLIAGIGIGVLITSKIVHFFLRQFPVGTYAVVTGMVLGSVFVIYRGMPADVGGFIASIIALAIGFYVALLLGKVEHKQ
ncbi:DUF368 domain-containing protein [Salicibibacter kimchii]|uniref:DUF368 domain-containing protein n=1 Tax=Salicibibacter kimchii TaxID=2099786 RepID=A0A345BZS4_9BACI|nr:DUF368 domain-containing protein [Salicibibacter kimchii]AXF56455.1 DUF368 domain-containing protein [Salicibibacter kimchii]